MYIYIYIYHIRIYLCVYSPSLEKGTQGLLYKRVGGVPKGYEFSCDRLYMCKANTLHDHPWKSPC